MNNQRNDAKVKSLDGVGPGVRVNMLGRVRAWWERQQTAQRLLGTDPFERRRITQDLGVGALDPGTLTASPVSGQSLLDHMMARFGVDEAAFGRNADGAFRDMRRVCVTCPSKRRCVRALSAQARAEECRDFCLNAETLVALASQGSPGGCAPVPYFGSTK